MTKWTKPEAKPVSLNMEVTAYVNTDGESRPAPATARPAAKAIVG